MDLVLLDANVLTMDGASRRFEALAVSGGKIASVGATVQIEPLITPATRVVRLQGRTVLPGFIDPHTHFSISTLEPVAVNCGSPPHATAQGVVDAVQAAAAAGQPGQWIRGWGFRSRLMPDGKPLTRRQLDDAAPVNPVCIIDGSVHCMYVNSAALRLAGIDKDTPDPPHGRILRDGDGEANGTLWEAAGSFVYTLSLQAHLDAYGEKMADLVRLNCERHLALGITSVADALVVPEAAQMYRLAESQAKLPMVLHQMLGGDAFYAPPERAARGEVPDGNVSHRLRGGTVKMFMDPIFPMAARIRFHPDGTEERFGERYYTQEEANELVLTAHRHGLQVAIHCLGTWSIEQALTAFEHAQRQYPVEDPEFRIEHYTMPTVAQIRRTSELGVVPVVQPAYMLAKRGGTPGAGDLGPQVRLHPYRTMLDHGLPVAASSDYPCAVLNPLVVVSAAVTRGNDSGGDVEAEAVSPMEALRMSTINAAVAMRREHEVGSIELGKRADLMVLSADPTSVATETIKDILVEQTYVEGARVYAR